MLIVRNMAAGRTTMENHRRVNTHNVPKISLAMMIMMTIEVLLFVLIFDTVDTIHAFIPSTSTTLHPQHHSFRTTSVRGVTTTTSDNNEKVDRPIERSTSLTKTSNHHESHMDATSSLSMNQIMNLTNKDISHMSFRELQRHVRTLMMMNESGDHTSKKAEEITRGMTTSILREKIRSLSNLCVIREDGVEDCSFDDERVKYSYATHT